MRHEFAIQFKEGALNPQASAEMKMKAPGDLTIVFIDACNKMDAGLEFHNYLVNASENR